MKKLTGTFRNTQWDPYLLISQIIAMQALLYASLGTIMYMMDYFAEANHTLDHLFEYHVGVLWFHFKMYLSKCPLFPTGNSRNRFGWKISYFRFCAQFTHRFRTTVVHRPEDEALFGLQLHIPPAPFGGVLVVQ